MVVADLLVRTVRASARRHPEQRALFEGIAKDLESRRYKNAVRFAQESLVCLPPGPLRDDVQQAYEGAREIQVIGILS
jgi:hypothetical protein